MTTLRTILAALLLCAAPAAGQTIKTLGFNTTNGEVTANTGTNFLRFTNTVRLIGGGPSQYSVLFGNTNVGIYYTNYNLTIANAGNLLTIPSAGSPISGNFAGSFTVSSAGSISFSGGANIGLTRTNLGLPLAALTNTSNATFMRALAGSTNTNHPFSGTVSVVGTNNTNTLTFSNGILQSVQ